MPVILDNGSESMWNWLDPKQTEWSKQLQSILKPYKGELECYPVSKEVGKVGNNSPTFVVPISSSKNKNNIANFFGSAQKSAKGKQGMRELAKDEKGALSGAKVNQDPDETRVTTDQEGSEDNAPLPMPKSGEKAGADRSRGVKREHDADDTEEEMTSSAPKKATKLSKTSISAKTANLEAISLKEDASHITDVSRRKTRSATSNASKHSPAKSAKTEPSIVKFFR